MKTKIEQDMCIGCGLCVQLAPYVFKMEQDKAYVISEEVSFDQEENTKVSVEKCPVAAITIE